MRFILDTEVDNVGDIVRAIRINLGYTQEDFGKEVDLSRRSLLRFENMRKNSPINTFFRILDAAGYTIEIKKTVDIFETKKEDENER